MVKFHGFDLNEMMNTDPSNSKTNRTRQNEDMALNHGREKGKQSMIHEKGKEKIDPDIMDSLSLTVICDVCSNPSEVDNVCFDLTGCGHILCYLCLTLHGVTDSITGGIKCPVTSCLNGLLYQYQEPLMQHIEKSLDEEDKKEDFFFCYICMEYKLTSEVFKGNSFNCGHMFCMCCMAGHVHAKVQENMYPIGCPNPGCHGKVEIEDCSGILNGDVLERWAVSLLEMGFPEGVKVYCPYNDCSALLVNEGDEDGSPLMDCECLHCNRLFCAQCRVPWHSGKTCEVYRKEVEKRREEAESSKFAEFARSKKWQKCLKCGIFVERTEGCLYIRCRCGHSFCYRCGSPMGADHFCKVCHKRWD